MNAAKDWTFEVFGDINKRKRSLQARLDGMQLKFDQGVVNGLLKLDKYLKAELDLLLKQDEPIWRHKPRCEWISTEE